jgi:hypothetical protein
MAHDQNLDIEIDLWAASLRSPRRFSHGEAAPISIAGHYTETLGKMHVRLHVHQDSGGKLTGTLDSVDEGDNGLLCDPFVRSGSKFSFSVPSLDGTYEGETNADRTVISGIWKQGGPTPLKFIREVQATAASLSGQLTEIDAITSAAFAKDHIGNVTVGVVCGNELVWTRNYRDADMEEHRAADNALSERSGIYDRKLSERCPIFRLIGDLSQVLR